MSTGLLTLQVRLGVEPWAMLSPPLGLVTVNVSAARALAVTAKRNNASVKKMSDPPSKNARGVPAKMCVRDRQQPAEPGRSTYTVLPCPA